MSEVGSLIGVLVYLVVVFGLLVLVIAAQWCIFTKAGYEGWKAIIPFYSTYCLCEMTTGNGFWFLLSFVPCANVFLTFFMNIKLAKSFGKDVGYGLGLVFLSVIFYPMLAFGDSEYVGVV